MKDRIQGVLLHKLSLLAIAAVLVIMASLVPVFIYSSFFIPSVAAAPKYTRGPIECDPTADMYDLICCQDETDSGGITIRWCTKCDDTPRGPSNCGPRYQESSAPTPSPTPVAPENALPQGEVQQLTPTPPPTGGKGIFGSNILPTQPTGIAPPTTTTTPSPSPQTTPPPTTGLKGPQEQLMAPEGGVLPPQSPAGGGEQGQSRIFDSPTGYCVPFNKITCVPCDPGLPGADCVPDSDWPPASTTDEDILLTTPTPTVPPLKSPFGALSPGVGTLQGDEAAQPQTEDDGTTGGDEEPPSEQPEQPEVQQPEEEPPNQGEAPAGPLT